jgi:alpha-L-fucosidase 2
MVFGGTKKERIALNQDSIWYGGPVDRINPDAKPHLDEIRKLIREEKIPEAEKLLRYCFSGTPQSERPYQPLGNVELTFYRDGQSEGDDGYRRELNLDEGMVQEKYDAGQTRIRKEYLASYPHGVIVIHMKAENGTISLDALLTRGRFYDHAGKLDDRTIYMDGTLGKGGVSFLAALRAETVGGHTEIMGEHLLVREAKELTFFISCETSFYEKDWEQAVRNRLDCACRDGYNKIRERHIEDYRSLYGRVTLEISENDTEGSDISDVPIDRRLEEGKERGFDGSFAALYFQYGRYLLLSCSRPGSLPANLQGIWNEDMQPAWDSKFTININTEMNYWPAEICNLSECHLPLFGHLRRMWENGKKTAEEMYGCRGFVAHHNTDIWGDCAPQDIYIPATYWVMGGAWLCTHIWLHYSYTKDEAFLRQMYPILRDAVLFFHDYLVEEDGEFVTIPSVSPENTYILPDKVRGCVCAGASMDIQILRDLFDDFLKASKVLEIEEEAVLTTMEIQKKLPKTKIGKYGQIMEWRKDYEEAAPGHRHISQLYALCPSHQITPDKTPKLAEAADKTLERRLAYGGGHTGWSCAWIVNFYERLGNAEAAWQNLNRLWSCSTFPNLMDNHPRKDGYVFQIDGNLGATAAIAEMLVQSDEDRVILLPALPKQWKNGKVTGLVVCGGAILSMEWKNGELASYSLKSENKTEITVFYRGEAKKIILD